MFVSLGMEKEIKVIKQSGLERTYDEKGNLIQIKDPKAGWYNNRSYDERNNCILEEGLGSKNLQPYWVKWERTYNEDGSQSVHQTTSYGYWEKYRVDEDFMYDFVNSNKRKFDIYELYKSPAEKAGGPKLVMRTAYEIDLDLFHRIEKMHKERKESYEKETN